MNTTDYLSSLSEFVSFEQASLFYFKQMKGSINLDGVCRIIDAMPVRPIHWLPTDPIEWSRSTVLCYKRSGFPVLFVTHKPCDIAKANDMVLGFVDGSGHGLETFSIAQILADGYILDVDYTTGD